MDKKLDLASTYPNAQIILNISKETTFRELCKIAGIDEEIQRRVAVNMTAAKTNSVAICREVMNYPTLDEMYDALMEERKSA